MSDSDSLLLLWDEYQLDKVLNHFLEHMNSLLLKIRQLYSEGGLGTISQEDLTNTFIADCLSILVERQTGYYKLKIAKIEAEDKTKLRNQIITRLIVGHLNRAQAH